MTKEILDGGFVGKNQLNTRVIQVFSNHLLKDEKIFWTGQPKRKVYFNIWDLLNVIFGLGWSVVLLSLLKIAWQTDDGIPLFIALTPLILVGFYQIFGRYIHSIYIRRNTFYAISDQRILWVSTFQEKIFHEIKRNDMPTFSIYRENTKAIGTILFTQDGPRLLGLVSSSRPLSLTSGPLAFDMISKVEVVNQLLNEVKS